ncbi:uncharacterized protein LOC124919459 [Impatiens glandulifera]|uniref:uncharacterized protein LOC124919459 n=1 Tax=Impatiens glandulifera TaxID=253017 RepID=UPI001FB0B020|nr:uncharacterized protein LOC124919459 [Impatiens glandulifera]
MKDHPQHPQHPLILYTHSPYPHPISYAGCDVCKSICQSMTPFFYHCAVCKFDVDLRCAFMSFLVCPRTLHNHELTAQLYPASYFCNCCGEKHRELGMSYQCKICWFWIHEKCYSLPQSIEHDSHVHRLNLCHLQGEVLPECLCGVCEEYINKQLGFYVCKSCEYYVHITCSIKKWDPPIIEEEEDQINDKLIQFPLPSTEVVHNMLAQFIKNICQWKDEDEEDKNGDILNHPSHIHPLTLEFDLSKFTNFNYSNTSRRDYEVCNGCMLPLLNDAPFYSCNLSTCNFVLHKWCAKLPRKLKHPDPAHTYIGHTLLLQEKCFSIFRCKGCQQLGNGFAYKCNACKGYYLDVRCAALPRRVNHETHKHPLLLKYGRSIGGCISCGVSNFFEDCKSMISNYSTSVLDCPTSFSFGCDACHFSIHPKCLILPREIVYWYDEHGFKLSDLTHILSGNGNDNQGASAYHCEFCKKEVYQERWIYHCFECDQCVDVDCVRELLGLFPNPLKFGGLYGSPYHKHPLTCIMTYPRFVCEHCHKLFCNIFRIGFECTECKIRFGVRCIFLFLE